MRNQLLSQMLFFYIFCFVIKKNYKFYLMSINRKNFFKIYCSIRPTDWSVNQKSYLSVKKFEPDVRHDLTICTQDRVVSAGLSCPDITKSVMKNNKKFISISVSCILLKQGCLNSSPHPLIGIKQRRNNYNVKRTNVLRDIQ